MARVPMRSAEAQLKAMLARYDAPIAATARGALIRMRRHFPGAFELVYDNYNALAIGFAPTDRASDALCSIALYPRWVTLFFLKGALLDDPRALLKGSGVCVRHIVLEPVQVVDTPAVKALLGQARAQARVPFPKRRALVIKSVPAKQRPRRPKG